MVTVVEVVGGGGAQPSRGGPGRPPGGDAKPRGHKGVALGQRSQHTQPASLQCARVFRESPKTSKMERRKEQEVSGGGKSCRTVGSGRLLRMEQLLVS